MLDQSIVSRLPKSSSVSGLSVIHRNINNRIPSSKTNHQIYPPPPPNPPISARTTNENDRKITLSGSTSEMLRCLATFVNTRYGYSVFMTDFASILGSKSRLNLRKLLCGWKMLTGSFLFKEMISIQHFITSSSQTRKLNFWWLKMKSV